MRRYIKDNRLFFETEHDTYTILCEVELKGYQDFYVENEDGDFDRQLPALGEPYDLSDAGYWLYFVYKVDEEVLGENIGEYIGEPTQSFSVEWAEKTIEDYEKEEYA